MLKKNKLRYNEYYDMQHIYDELYAQSKNGNNFYKLLEIIGSEQNICLAYRNLKLNSNACKINTYRHFCCLLVSYSPILVLFQHFSDQIYTSIPS